MFQEVLECYYNESPLMFLCLNNKRLIESYLVGLRSHPYIQIIDIVIYTVEITRFDMWNPLNVPAIGSEITYLLAGLLCTTSISEQNTRSRAFGIHLMFVEYVVVKWI